MNSGEVHRSSFIVHRSVLIVVLFLAVRIPLLFVRQPFFDELFTHWISSRSFSGILQALYFDSGPPLYYFIVHLLGHPRVLSLAFATIALIVLLADDRLAAAALIAVFPPAVLFSVDARSYALCAMFITFGVLALDRERPFVAAIAFVLAAYTHYYGLLFFPLLFLFGRLKPALTLLLFAPGLWLALHQPRAAMGWMTRFAYPDALFVRPPVLLLVITAVFMLAAAWPPSRFTWMTIVPSLLAIPIYVPLRFESVIAAPLTLWLGNARRVVLIGLLGCFLAWTTLGIVDHLHRPIDGYRDAALHLGQVREPVVASGYLYLETIMIRPATAFPAEQALHPGWRASATSGSELPVGTFIWIGERAAPELSIIRRSRRVEPLYVNARAMIARVR